MCSHMCVYVFAQGGYVCVLVSVMPWGDMCAHTCVCVHAGTLVPACGLAWGPMQAHTCPLCV